MNPNVLGGLPLLPLTFLRPHVEILRAAPKAQSSTAAVKSVAGSGEEQGDDVRNCSDFHGCHCEKL